jgi:hypothetical protein
MKKLNSIILMSALITAPIFFTGCDKNDDNKVGRDRNVPNNIEDNYSGDADASRNKNSNENEEQSSKMKKMGTKDHVYKRDKSSNKMSFSDLEKRVKNLEAEVAKMRKNEKVGQK